MRKTKKKLRRSPATWKLPIKPLLLALLAIGTGVTIAISFRSAADGILARLDHLPDSQIPFDQVHISDRPDWLLVDPVATLFEEAGLDRQRLPLSRRDLTQTIGQSLSLSPWVRQVKVKKGYRQLSINITYRQPVLCVPVGSGKECFYVDEEGVLLPVGGQVADHGLVHCLVAEGIVGVALPRPGEPVEDRRVQAAARLAGQLSEDKSRLDLLVIVAKEQTGGEVSCLVKTRLGSQIHWGVVRPETDLEVATKLGRLISYAAENGSLEQPKGPYEFDVTREEPTVARLADRGRQGG